MKKQPYKGIINLRDERKEYGRLCRGKSKIYKFYTDWETHIRECLLSFNNSQDLYNFKRYCINIDRGAQVAPEMFTNYVILLIPIYIDILFKDIPPFSVIISALIIIIYGIRQNLKLNQDRYIFHDIIEIIEKIEKEQSETSSSCL